MRRSKPDFVLPMQGEREVLEVYGWKIPSEPARVKRTEPALNEPYLIEKPDGWYVEVQTVDGIASAGPTSKERAEAVFRDVELDMKPMKTTEPQ